VRLYRFSARRTEDRRVSLMQSGGKLWTGVRSTFGEFGDD